MGSGSYWSVPCAVLLTRADRWSDLRPLRDGAEEAQWTPLRRVIAPNPPPRLSGKWGENGCLIAFGKGAVLAAPGCSCPAMLGVRVSSCFNLDRALSLTNSSLPQRTQTAQDGPQQFRRQPHGIGKPDRVHKLPTAPRDRRSSRRGQGNGSVGRQTCCRGAQFVLGRPLNRIVFIRHHTSDPLHS